MKAPAPDPIEAALDPQIDWQHPAWRALNVDPPKPPKAQPKNDSAKPPIRDLNRKATRPNVAHPVKSTTDRAQGDDALIVKLVSKQAARSWLVLTNPRYLALSIEDRARRAKVSVGYMRRFMAQPVVGNALNEHWRGQLRASTPAVLRLVLANATLPGREGYKDRELFTKLTKLLEENVRVSGEVGVKDGGIAKALGDALAQVEPRRNPQPVVLEASKTPGKPGSFASR